MPNVGTLSGFFPLFTSSSAVCALTIALQQQASTAMIFFIGVPSMLLYRQSRMSRCLRAWRRFAPGSSMPTRFVRARRSAILRGRLRGYRAGRFGRIGLGVLAGQLRRTALESLLLAVEAGLAGPGPFQI